MIGVIHISDIHFRNGFNSAANRALQIKGAVLSEVYDVHELLLLISGDVAFSGKQEEYSVATEFVAEMEEVLHNIPRITFLGTVVIPGNHDCNFKNESEVRPALLSTVGERLEIVEASGDFVEQMLKVQEDFFSFEELISRKPRPKGQRLLWTHEFSSSAGKILVRCFNTAWLSREKEVIGQLYFPIQAVSDISGTDANLILSVFHHPYPWFQPENRRAFTRLIETTSDIVFTGHEHDGEVYAKTSGMGATVNYVEGAALQADGIGTGFHFVKVDLNAQTYQVRQFEWRGDIYASGPINASMFTRNQALMEHQFVNNAAFKKELEDIGTLFTHNVKTHLILPDLFVYPDLKVTTFRSASANETVVRSADVFEYIASKPSLCIAGAPSSGKTSLAKTLYGDLLLRRKHIPVLIQASDFRGPSPSQVHAAVERAFEQQYSKRLVERFNQLDPDAKTVIVDDWHEVPLAAKAKARVLDALEKTFGNVILLTDDASLFSQVTEAVSSGSLPAAEYCEIRQFGHHLRGQLVTKWESLGRELDTEELELTHDIAEKEYLLDTLIGKGIVPAYPFFVFSVLQAHDSATHSTAFGAYGHIYQGLITTRLARVSSKNLGQKFTYLSLVAFRLLETGRDTLSPTEYKEVHERYEKEYIATVNKEKLLEELEAAQILSVADGEVRFKYRYAYYFFAAHFFHDGISNVKEANALRERLKVLADTAHDEENAHIIIFYLYMSKDRILLEHILRNASSLFSEEGQADLSDDLAFANRFYSAMPLIEAPSDATEANREERRKQLDEAEESGPGEQIADTPDTLKINFAFQSMNIMGQVLRNFPGDLRADLKLQLTQGSYGLGLRLLRAFLKFLQTNIDAFRRDMVTYFKLHQPLTRRHDDALQAAADKAVVSFVEIVLFASIKKISMSVGLEELKDTYEVVRNAAGEDHLPTRIIDLAIRLDHFAQIPERDVEDLKMRLRGNPAVYTTLRMLVGQFLYLFPVEYRVRQRMIELLDFQPGPATMSADKRVKKLEMAKE